MNQLKQFRTLIGGIVSLVLMMIVLWIGFEWTVNRVYVPVGYSLVLTYKGPLLFGSAEHAKPGQFAKVDENGTPLEIGMLEQMKGPGRHFYCPIWWETKVEQDFTVKPGEVAVVTRKRGLLPKVVGDQYLIDDDLDNENDPANKERFQGVLRKVYGPGCYRINPDAYDFKIIKSMSREENNQVKHWGWVDIPTGYVGVATNLTSNPATGETDGIQDKVLPPGLYPINEQEKQIDIVEIGFREKSLAASRKLDKNGDLLLDASGEPMIDDESGGITFPSKDAFQIHMDFTAVWGIMPDQAAAAIHKFGNVAAVENKIVVPQIESISRNKGSELGAEELMVGQTRQDFQEKSRQAFAAALEQNHLTLLYGLVRDIHIPLEVRVPIQQANLANELKATREQEQLTAKTEASLRESERMVELESERIIVETERKVALVKAEGAKKAAETKAETIKLVATIDRQTAEIEAQATVLRGQALADADRIFNEAQSEKFTLAVKAFGSGAAYNQWVFATGLPDDIKLQTLYAGQGTFWTDLKGFSETLLGRQAQQPQPTSSVIPTAKPNR